MISDLKYDLITDNQNYKLFIEEEKGKMEKDAIKKAFRESTPIVIVAAKGYGFVQRVNHILDGDGFAGKTKMAYFHGTQEESTKELILQQERDIQDYTANYELFVPFFGSIRYPKMSVIKLLERVKNITDLEKTLLDFYPEFTSMPEKRRINIEKLAIKGIFSQLRE